jgi:DNA polymerase III delta prime subunit
MIKWLLSRTHPAFLLIGPPGVGKTTMVYRVCKAHMYWIQEFNASHTRTGSSFRQTIMPLLTETGVSKWIHPSTPNGRAILLDEMDGLSQGEKGGLQELHGRLPHGLPLRASRAREGGPQHALCGRRGA